MLTEIEKVGGKFYLANSTRLGYRIMVNVAFT